MGCFGCCIVSTNPVVVDLFGDSKLLDCYRPRKFAKLKFNTKTADDQKYSTEKESVTVKTAMNNIEATSKDLLVVKDGRFSVIQILA